MRFPDIRRLIPRSFPGRLALAAGAGGVLAWLFWPSAAWAGDFPLPQLYPGNPSAGGSPTPRGPRYNAQQIPPYPGNRCDAVKMLLRIIEATGLLSGRPAVLFLAHVCRETGYGRHVWNSNFGNIRAWASTTSPWHRLSDGLPYLTFLDPLEGMRRCIAFLDGSHATRYSSYPRAKAKLLAGDPTWYTDLGLAGYYEWRNPATGVYEPHTPASINLPGQGQQDYNAFLREVERCLAA